MNSHKEIEMPTSQPHNHFYVFLTIIGTWQNMNLDSFIISIPHATIKEHNSPPSTSIPTQLCITLEEKNDTNHETQMQERKKQNLFLHVSTFKIGILYQEPFLGHHF